MPVRQKAIEITDLLWLHSSTVVALSCIWYCIGFLFCEVLIGLHVCTWIWVIEEMKHVQYRNLEQRAYKSCLLAFLGIKKFLYLAKLWLWLSSYLENCWYHFSQICGIIGHSVSYMDGVLGPISSNIGGMMGPDFESEWHNPVQN